MNPEKIGSQIAKTILLEEVVERVALYPGAFKPPHKGHVATALRAKEGDIDRVIIFMSTKERDGVSVEEAQQVWDLYKQNNPELEKVEIVQTPVPVKAVYDYAKDNPSHDIRAVFGKGEQERFQSLLDKEKYPHVEVFDAGMEGTYSATDLRKAIRDNDLEAVNEFVPDGINVDDFMSIFQLTEADPKKGTGKKPKGSGRRLYTDEDPSDTVGVKFSSRQDIVDTLNKTSFKNKSHARQSQVINLIHQRVRAAYNRAKDPLVKARLKKALAYAEQRKEASKKKTQRMKKEDRYLQEARYKKFLNEGWDNSKGKVIGDFVNYVSEYLSVTKPKIKLINQEGYTQEHRSFGGYMPSEQKILVVVHNRNMADILRTVAHEMVHHMQNLDNRLEPNSGEDGSPEENEANSLAGVIMRQFGRENEHIYE